MAARRRAPEHQAVRHDRGMGRVMAVSLFDVLVSGTPEFLPLRGPLSYAGGGLLVSASLLLAFDIRRRMGSRPNAR
jgi:hypothetical protein